MNTQYFPNFIRANYPSVAEESNESLIEIGDLFKEYLQERFCDKMDKLQPIWDIDPKTVVMNQMSGNILFIKGYHSALFIHFEQFVEKTKKENPIDNE